MNGESPDAVVIGSGLAGLTTAAYLATNGVRPLVLEQYDVIGGCSHVFRRKNSFEFDVGIHYVGDCSPAGLVTKLLAGVGLAERIEFLPMDEGFDRLLFPDHTFVVRRGWENYERDLLDRFPAEAGQIIRRCLKTLRTIADEAMASRPPDGLLGILAAPLRSPALVRWSERTLAELFDRCDLGSIARAVLAAQSGTYAAPPSRASVIVHAVLVDHYLRSGGYYPRGGGPGDRRPPPRRDLLPRRRGQDAGAGRAHTDRRRSRPRRPAARRRGDQGASRRLGLRPEAHLSGASGS